MSAVVPIEEGVAVVGETVTDAQRGLHALNVSWDDTAAERRSSSALLAEHLRLRSTSTGRSQTDTQSDRTVLPTAERSRHKEQETS